MLFSRAIKYLSPALLCVAMSIDPHSSQAQFYSPDGPPDIKPYLNKDPAAAILGPDTTRVPVQTVDLSHVSYQPSVATLQPILPAPPPPQILPPTPAAQPVRPEILPAPSTLSSYHENKLQKPKLINLSTDQGIEVGAQVSRYHYQEHVIANEDFVTQEGFKYGITGTGTAVFRYGLFATADLRLAYGTNNYTSANTGKVNNFAGDFIGEGRMLVGKDFILGETPQSSAYLDISPYLGLGVRYLNNDSSGEVNNGKYGYRRSSEYFYFPTGTTERFRVSDNARLALNTEFDFILHGQQTSYLNDASPQLPNVVNDQSSGLGLRASLMYERTSWAIGPFFNYWNIEQSHQTTFECYPDLCGATEPHNQTLEYGAQARYRF